MNAFAKLLTAAAAAALLAVSPVSAQTTGTGDASEGGTAEAAIPLEQQVAPEQRATMGTTFRSLTLPPAVNVTFDPTIGAAVPDTVVLNPVPDEIVAVVPGTRDYEYFTLPDNRIVLVHPEERTIAMILD